MSRLVIFFPLFLVMILDLIFTMVGQPKNYWTNYSLLSEISPLGHILLLIGPEYFIIAFLCYLLSVFILTLPTYLPKKLSFVRSVIIVTLFLGHSWGSSSWLGIIVFRLFSIELNDWYYEWYLKTGYFAFIAVITSFCLHNKFELKYSKSKANSLISAKNTDPPGAI